MTNAQAGADEAPPPPAPPLPTRSQRADIALRRLLSPQSALTMHDLLNLARMCEGQQAHAVLDRLYEWYFSRTTTAIRVAYGAAVGLAVALYDLVSKPDAPDHEWLNRGLAAVAVVCVVAGIYQRRELAQLHRELAAASRLLSDLRGVDAAYLRPVHAPPETPPSGKRAAGIIIILVVIAAAFAVGIVWAVTPIRALAVVAALTALLALPHVAAEKWSKGQRSTAEPSTLEQAIGHVRLDDYVLDAKARDTVNAAMRNPGFVGATAAAKAGK
jgi:hypothetical protein